MNVKTFVPGSNYLSSEIVDASDRVSHTVMLAGGRICRRHVAHLWIWHSHEYDVSSSENMKPEE